MKRVIITGARAWYDEAYLYGALDEVLTTVGPFVLVQGDAEEGADAMAKAWAISRGVDHEDVPADWFRDCDENCHHRPAWRGGKPICRQAGFVRNQEMADRGGDFCLAFPFGPSHGTKDMMRRAKSAGIDVIDLGELRG